MLKRYPKLNFPPIKLRAKCSDDGRGVSVWSSTRGCYLVLTPEEWVRRHLVEYLMSRYALPPTQIIEEYPVSMNGQPQRADVVVVEGTRVVALVECKAPEVKLSRETLSQAARYNSVLAARYIILTNGVTHLCFEFASGSYRALSEFPERLSLEG